MAGIYIASTTTRAGKSLMALSLGLILQKNGMSVGYLKPVGRLPQIREELLGDADALVVQEVLGQNAPANLVTPVMLPRNLHELAVWKDNPEASSIDLIRYSYKKLSEGRDHMLVSGTGTFPAAGRFAGTDSLHVVRQLGLKVLFVERYSSGINYDELLFLKTALGDAMLGVVINRVPSEDMRDVKRILSPWLREQGIAVHGIIHNEPELAAMRVADLAQGVNGRVVASNAHAARMVRGFVIGTMQVDNFMSHLRRKAGSAVIVGGDRSDLQLAALHAQSPCLILTGNIAPSDLIRSTAEAKGVPLVVVKEDTYSVARMVERILSSKKLRELHQIRLGAELVENALHLPGLLRLL